MRIDFDSSKISTNDYVIVANNRQILAFKDSWQNLNGVSEIPKVNTWKGFIKELFELHNASKEHQLINDNLIAKCFQQILGSSISKNKKLIKEIVNNLIICENYLINIESSNYEIDSEFVRWHKEYQDIKKQLNFLDIYDFQKLLLSDHIEFKKNIAVLGFDNLYPVQLKILNLFNYQLMASHRSEAKGNFLEFNNIHDEIIYISNWAKEVSESNPNETIGVICPTLDQHYSLILNQFDKTFSSRLVEIGNKKFNISFGKKFSSYPLISNLLNFYKFFIEFNQARISKDNLDKFFRLMSLSTNKNLTKESAELAFEIKKLKRDFLSSKIILDKSTDKRHLEELLSKLQDLSFPREESHEFWLDHFAKLINVFFSIRDQSLSSSEYQALNKYIEDSKYVNTYQQLTPKITAKTFYLELKNLFDETLFQPQGPKSNIQILGLLEAKGLSFDHAWIMNLTHEVIPGKIKKPKFLSQRICIKNHVQGSSYDLVQQEANSNIESMMNISEDINGSFSINQFDEIKSPSPLLEFTSAPATSINTQSDTSFELIDDFEASPFQENSLKSAINTIKDQIACPFKGFARRFQIEFFDDPVVGIDAFERGNLMHKTLHKIFETIHSSEQLANINDEDLSEIINQSISSSFPDSSNNFYSIEKDRLFQILWEFISLEKDRDSFIVLNTEKEFDFSISGIQFKGQIDRIDKIGSQKVVIDYKSGKAANNPWCGDYLKEPQLPIYSQYEDADGILQIHLTSESIKSLGLSKNEELNFPNKTKQTRCEDWNNQSEIWDERIVSGFDDFKKGYALVKPKDATVCQYCEFSLLCRIEK